MNRAVFVACLLAGTAGLSAAAPAPEIEIVLYSGTVPVGERDPATAFSLDGGQTWAPSFCIAPHPAYGILPGTAYLHSGPSIYEGADAALFRARFRLPERFAAPSLRVLVHADNAARVFLNGISIGEQPFGVTVDNFTDPAEGFGTDDPALFRSGENILEFQVVNFGGPGGFNYSAIVRATGADEPPTAVISAPAAVEADSPEGAVVTLDGSSSEDPDGDPLTYAWSEGGRVLSRDPVFTPTLPIGLYVFTLTVTDPSGQSDEALATVVVVDSTPPSISRAAACPNVLWPPCRQMVAVNVRVSAFDAADPSFSSAIVSVDSSEPGDGDIEQTGPLSLRLRAERSMRGPGRTYTITVECRDASGNVSRASTSVFVPPCQRRSR